jgi:hypothetical protein
VSSSTHPRGSIFGPQAWASYSRHADLGNGMIVYTIEGISWTVLAIVAAISFRRDRRSPQSAGPPIYVTALFMIIVMALTMMAAPVMLGVERLANDPEGTLKAFEQFTFGASKFAARSSRLPSSPTSGPSSH